MTFCYNSSLKFKEDELTCDFGKKKKKTGMSFYLSYLSKSAKETTFTAHSQSWIKVINKTNILKVFYIMDQIKDEQSHE